jgi:hypothetical protein
MVNMSQGEGALGEEGDRELRSGTLKLMATIIRRFPGAVDFSPLWSRFFTAVAPLMPRLVAEVISAPCADSPAPWTTRLEKGALRYHDYVTPVRLRKMILDELICHITSDKSSFWIGVILCRSLCFRN